MELNKIFKRQTYLIVSAIIILLLIFITISYAYFTSTKTSQGNVVVKSGDLEVAFNGSNVIDGELVPISDLDGMSSEGYTFRVTNTGSLNTAYKVEIYVDKSVSGTHIPHQYVMVSYNGEEGRQLSNITKSITGSTEVDNVYLIGSGEVTRNNTKDNVIRLWIKDDAPTSIKENKVAFKIKVTSEVKSGELAGEQPICIRAKALHTEICTNGGCLLNYQSNDKITYGNEMITPGELNVGDAFTCDVNGDGIYDEDTERFYYVSGLYTGNDFSTQIFNRDIAVLIYYNNLIIENNNLILNSQTFVVYNENSINSAGPVTAAAHLPSKLQWSNINLISLDENGKRQIRNENGNNVVLYDYADKVSRMITTQEIVNACGVSLGDFSDGALISKCKFLLENTNYSKTDNIHGYWYETPSSGNRRLIWGTYGLKSRVCREDVTYSAENPWYLGVRPVIEILKTDIEY